MPHPVTGSGRRLALLAACAVLAASCLTGSCLSRQPEPAPPPATPKEPPQGLPPGTPGEAPGDTAAATGAALDFFRRWGNLDFEGMAALMAASPEEFVRNSDIVFAPFYPRHFPADLPEFFAAARDQVRQYDPDAWQDIRVVRVTPDPAEEVSLVRLELRLGEAPYQVWADVVPGDRGWTVRMIDSLPVPAPGGVPPSSWSLGRLQPTDVRDLDGRPGAEILGWGRWGEYEGEGREPPAARGLFTVKEGKLQTVWLTREGPAPDRNWTGEGVMGHLAGPDTLDLLLVSRPVYVDGRPVSDEPPRATLYRLRNGATPGTRPEAVGDVAWPVLAPAGTSVHYGLMAARPLDGEPGDEIVVLAFCTPPQGSSYELVAVCRLAGRSLEVLTTYRGPDGGSLYLTLARPAAAAAAGGAAAASADGATETAHRLYVWTYDSDRVAVLAFRQGAPTWENLPLPHLRLLAAADLDGEGVDEFLVETPRHRLRVLDASGRMLWETADYRTVERAWMGRHGDRVLLVLGERGADGTRLVRWEAPSADGSAVSTDGGRGLPGGSGGTPGSGSGSPGSGPEEGKASPLAFRRTWVSPLLGRYTISSLWVDDLDGDGEPEAMVTSTDDYLAAADYVHVFALKGDPRPR